MNTAPPIENLYTAIELVATTHTIEELERAVPKTVGSCGTPDQLIKRLAYLYLQRIRHNQYYDTPTPPSLRDYLAEYDPMAQEEWDRVHAPA